MCGIWAYIQLYKGLELTPADLYRDFMELQARGPDSTVFQTIKNVTVGFHRLAIMDPTFHANQPYIIEDGERTIVFIGNGEIYNFKSLIAKHDLHVPNNSDCMTIPKLFIKYDSKFDKYNTSKFEELFLEEIKGEFAFVMMVFDRFQNLRRIVAGRDQIGIRPMYYTPEHKMSTAMVFSSEIKGINRMFQVSEFPPGVIMDIKVRDIVDVYGKTDIKHFSFKPEPCWSFRYDRDSLLSDVHNAVVNSVRRRLTADRPIAFLLSGGVDSSLVAAISARLLGTPIKTFCCGMSQGTDLLYARKVAEYIGSQHTEVMFTPEEGLAAIDDVIRTTETWDTTTIRASVGQYLVCKHIGTQTDAKVVMVGEGPDEVCSSYLFNYYAPTGIAMHKAAIDYVNEIHMYDGRRADRCISRWGLEGRVPLLDPEFISAYWNIPCEWRMPTYKGIEKWWLRQAFSNGGVLPADVLWRKKEAFSDGVSGKERSWYQMIQDHIETLITDSEFATAPVSWGCSTKEQYYYKREFVRHFGELRLNVIHHYWQPKWSADGVEVKAYIDPSARVLGAYLK